MDTPIAEVHQLWWDTDRGAFVPKPPRKLAQQQQRWFMPRIPQYEYICACRCSPTAAVVYTVLMQLSLLQRSDRVTLSSTALKRFSISRWQKDRALRALEHVGLITVERTHAKNPVVTLHTIARKE